MAVLMTRKVLADICIRFNRNPDAAPTAVLQKVLPFIKDYDRTTYEEMIKVIVARVKDR